MRRAKIMNSDGFKFEKDKILALIRQLDVQRSSLDDQMQKLRLELVQLEKTYLDSFDINVGDKVLYKGQKYFIYNRRLYYGDHSPRFTLVPQTKKGLLPQKLVVGWLDGVDISEIKKGWD
jgi:hypothetical protein